MQHHWTWTVESLEWRLMIRRDSKEGYSDVNFNTTVEATWINGNCKKEEDRAEQRLRIPWQQWSWGEPKERELLERRWCPVLSRLWKEAQKWRLRTGHWVGQRKHWELHWHSQMVLRWGERLRGQELSQVLTWSPTAEAYGRWCTFCCSCGGWFFPTGELCDFEGDTKW